MFWYHRCDTLKLAKMIMNISTGPSIRELAVRVASLISVHTRLGVVQGELMVPGSLPYSRQGISVAR